MRTRWSRGLVIFQSIRVRLGVVIDSGVGSAPALQDAINDTFCGATYDAKLFVYRSPMMLSVMFFFWLYAYVVDVLNRGGVHESLAVSHYLYH